MIICNDAVYKPTLAKIINGNHYWSTATTNAFISIYSQRDVTAAVLFALGIKSYTYIQELIGYYRETSRFMYF